MLSIEKCKKILVDDNETYTDEEIKKIRAELYKMASFVNGVKIFRKRVYEFIITNGKVF